MSRDEITSLLERGAGPAPDGPDVEQVWRRGLRRRALKRTGTSVAVVTAVAALVVAGPALLADRAPGVDIGPVETPQPPVEREVEVPDVEAGSAALPPLEERTVAIVIAIRDGQADFVQIDSGQITTRDLPELAPGDPPLRMVDGDRLVLYGGDTIHAMDPNPVATPEPIVETDSFAVFVPSGVGDRIWVRPGRTDGAVAEVRQVDMTGATVLGPAPSPGGNLAVGLREAVVLQRSDGLVVWDPTTDEIVQEVDGPFPMGTDGDRFAWCDSECRDLHVADPSAETTTSVAELPEGFSFAGYAGRISPDGRFLAAPVCAEGPGGRCALAVLDLHSDRAWTVADGWATSSAPAWSPDSRWVFTTNDDGRLAAYQPGNRQAALVDAPQLDRVLGLGVIAAPPSPGSESSTDARTNDRRPTAPYASRLPNGQDA